MSFNEEEEGGPRCYGGVMQSTVVSWYDLNAVRLVTAYEALTPLPAQKWLQGLLPTEPALVVDVGSGSGRDAAAYAEAGHEVVAVEPSSAMRAEAVRLHPSARIRWLADSLPALATSTRAGFLADLVSMNAVWQHVAPTDRPRAFRKLVGLLRSGGLLTMTLRHGPDDGRGAYPVSLAEVKVLARDHGLEVVRTVTMADLMGRLDVSWTGVALRLPDDGTGALPLLRHLILLDSKSATYKLGLLRVLCRAADGAAGMAKDDGDEHVRLPLGLVALMWLRLYMPLVAADVPQTPGNRRGSEGLGFAGPGWKALAAGAASQRDLRVGAVFGGATATAVHAALCEAAVHVCKMPVNHLTYPNGGHILKTIRTRSTPSDGTLVLDERTLSAFGSIRVPRDLWTAMSRFAVWIEPAIIAEWIRLTHRYAASQERDVGVGIMAAAMTWSDPDRDVALPRARALALMDEGQPVHCVWSGRRLTARRLDIDHCLPWSAWPCGDLWNLLPSDRDVNQGAKRDKLPSTEALASAGDAILEWWTAAYLRPQDHVLPVRFEAEARASLPGLSTTQSIAPADVRSAVALQRLRLHQDQSLPEWNGIGRDQGRERLPHP